MSGSIGVALRRERVGEAGGSGAIAAKEGCSPPQHCRSFVTSDGRIALDANGGCGVHLTRVVRAWGSAWGSGSVDKRQNQKHGVCISPVRS